MKLNIYSIYDSAAGSYMNPFVMQSDAQALRAFTDIATDAEHDIGKHPEDYSVWYIGQFHQIKGELVSENRECLATAMECVASSREEGLKKLRSVENA